MQCDFIFNLKPYYILPNDIYNICQNNRIWLYNCLLYNNINQLVYKKNILATTIRFNYYKWKFYSYTQRNLDIIVTMNEYLDFSSVYLFLLQLPNKIYSQYIYLMQVINYDNEVLNLFENRCYICLLNEKYLCAIAEEKENNNKYLKYINYSYYYQQLQNVIESYILLHDIQEENYNVF